MAKAKKQKFPEVLYVQQNDAGGLLYADDTFDSADDTEPIAVYRLEDVQTLKVTRELV